MIRLFKNYFQVLKFRIFNNKLSIFCNFLHEINYFLAKLVFLFKLRNNNKIKGLSNELKEQGYIIFDNDRCKNDLNLLATKISNSFDQKENLIYQNDKVLYLNPTFLNQDDLKKIFTKELIDCVEEYFKSSFKIYSYHIYRTDYSRKDDEDSYLWHTDNSTRHSLKLMFYLDNVSAEEGAMEIINTTNSKKIFKAGFYDRKQQNKFQNILDANANKCEASFGNIVIFKNGINLHRARKPLSKKRDVINVNVYPSIENFKKFIDKDMGKLFFNSGFSLNPLTNKPQNLLKIEKN